MATPITLYFDLVSPYAWLALHAVDAIQQATGRAVIVTPVAFGAILKRHGQPAPVEVPGKRAQIFDDIRWRAAERGLPFTGPPAHPFNPLHGLRLCLAVTDPARRAVLARHLADAAWSQGRDLQQAQVVLDVAGACGLPETWARAQIADPGIKQALIDTTDRAADGGVFGVPTFALDGRLFWGNDRIPHLLAAARGEGPPAA
ncbi:MAG: 2-hydroxychromene-2-carboxylate isomerase [Immundisolibacter sp.]|uniref:2-hydroxychromene-2-carboxylate isomerase n=1 Tax=Immundisolibacter sp. TaxID=1934948 RepID=UPI0019BAFFF6|nr:2-hydroxychromene-2-carboxylate isomerase [Immundisolibacter sp.]MBC7163015.1 2-hydroxychromene-2-carboxylate isomerase [Immundisolibacter sp.]